MKQRWRPRNGHRDGRAIADVQQELGECKSAQNTVQAPEVLPEESQKPMPASPHITPQGSFMTRESPKLADDDDTEGGFKQAWGTVPNGTPVGVDLVPGDHELDEAGPSRTLSHSDAYESRPSTSAEVIDESTPKNRRGSKKSYVSPRTPDSQTAVRGPKAKSKQPKAALAKATEAAAPAPPSGESSRPRVPPRTKRPSPKFLRTSQTLF